MQIINMNNVYAGCLAQSVAVGASAIAEPQRDDPISVPGIQHLRKPKHYQMRPRKKWRRAGVCVFIQGGRVQITYEHTFSLKFSKHLSLLHFVERIIS